VEIDRADAASNAEVQIRRDIAEAAVDRNKRIDMHRKAIEELYPSSHNPIRQYTIDCLFCKQLAKSTRSNNKNIK